MMHNAELTEGTRKAIKVGICLILIGQIAANAFLLYAHGKLLPIRTDPRVGLLLIPGFVYLMMTNVPEVMNKSMGIRRQAIHLADWWLAFAIWQFVGGTSKGPLVVLFMIGALIAVLSVKDAIRVQA